jgi:hypothetical protein
LADDQSRTGDERKFSFSVGPEGRVAVDDHPNLVVDISYSMAP